MKRSIRPSLPGTTSDLGHHLKDVWKRLLTEDDVEMVEAGGCAAMVNAIAATDDETVQAGGTATSGSAATDDDSHD